MADLRGKQLKDSFHNLVTFDKDTGSLEDGEGKTLNGIRSAQFIEIGQDSTKIMVESLPRSGFLFVSQLASDEEGCIATYNTFNGNCTILLQKGSLFTDNTGVPSGTTGPDGKANLFVDPTNSRFYIENRQPDEQFSVFLIGIE